MTSEPIVEQVKEHVCEHFQLDEEKVKSMLPVFFSTLQSHMEKLEKAVSENSMEAIGRSGHALKGALLNLGLEQTAGIAKMVEKEGKEKNKDADYSGMFEQLREQLQEILQVGQGEGR